MSRLIIPGGGGSSGGGSNSARIKFIEDAQDSAINGSFDSGAWVYDPDAFCWTNPTSTFISLNFEIENVTRLASILVDLYAMETGAELQIKMFTDSARTSLIGRLAFQSDGNVVLYSGTDAVLGATGTGKYTPGVSFRGILTWDIVSGALTSMVSGGAAYGSKGDDGITAPTPPAIVYCTVDMVYSAVTLVAAGYSPNMDIIAGV